MNWIANAIKLEMRMETGTARRGKYTLPKSCELVIKVFDVLVMQVEKYAHTTV